MFYIFFLTEFYLDDAKSSKFLNSKVKVNEREYEQFTNAMNKLGFADEEMKSKWISMHHSKMLQSLSISPPLYFSPLYLSPCLPFCLFVPLSVSLSHSLHLSASFSVCPSLSPVLCLSLYLYCLSLSHSVSLCVYIGNHI